MGKRWDDTRSVRYYAVDEIRRIMRHTDITDANLRKLIVYLGLNEEYVPSPLEFIKIELSNRNRVKRIAIEIALRGLMMPLIIVGYFLGYTYALTGTFLLALYLLLRNVAFKTYASSLVHSALNNFYGINRKYSMRKTIIMAFLIINTVAFLIGVSVGVYAKMMTKAILNGGENGKIFDKQHICIMDPLVMKLPLPIRAVLVITAMVYYISLYLTLFAGGIALTLLLIFDLIRLTLEECHFYVCEYRNIE